MGECALKFLREQTEESEIVSSQVTRGTQRQEVLVIGGGPAGLAAAIAARLSGYAVTVVDRARPPIDKACGEGILPAGVSALQSLGVPTLPAHGFPLRGIRFVSGRISAEAAFPSGCGLGLRRTHLHELLMERAEELGVRMEWGCLRGLHERSGFRWIVGADGVRSLTGLRAGLGTVRPDSSRFGFRRHYRIAPWTDHVEVYWGAHDQVYVTPVAEDEVGIAVLTQNPRTRLGAALQEFPLLRKRLDRAPAISAERGALTVSRRLQRVIRGNTLVIGDASGSVDAITGEGLTLAFRQSVALRDCLLTGDVNLYASTHTAILRRASLAERVFLLLDRFPRLRHSVVKTLAAQPAVFRTLLAMLG